MRTQHLESFLGKIVVYKTKKENRTVVGKVVGVSKVLVDDELKLHVLEKDMLTGGFNMHHWVDYTEKNVKILNEQEVEHYKRFF